MHVQNIIVECSMFSVVQLRGAVATRGHAAVVSGKEILIFGGEAPLDPSASALEPSQLLLLINTGMFIETVWRPSPAC